MEIEVSGLKNATKGGILVECKNKEAVETFRKEATEKLGDKYNVHIPKKRLPKIKIIGVSEKLTSEEFKSKAVSQNSYIKEESHLEVFTSVKQRNSNRYIIIIIIILVYLALLYIVTTKKIYK